MGTSGGSTLVAHDAATPLDDTDARIARVFYDWSGDDLYIHGNDPTDIATVSASDTTPIIADPQPSNNVFLADWSNSYNRQFRGQIAEIIIFQNTTFSAAQETALQTYLAEKWGVEV